MLPNSRGSWTSWLCGDSFTSSCFLLIFGHTISRDVIGISLDIKSFGRQTFVFKILVGILLSFVHVVSC